MNMYAYVGSDPINFVDPSGEVLVPVGTSANIAAYNTAINYVSADPAAADIARLTKSSNTYRVYIKVGNPTIYDPKTRNIGWDPKEAIKIDDGVQSPALGLRHELDHAAEHDRTGNAITRKNGKSTKATRSEEKRAVGNESKTASILGEPARNSHSEGTPIQVETSTTSCVKTKSNPC